MKYIDLTLPTPAENLACDEALLNRCEEGAEDEILRFWESQELFAVVGYANHIAQEVNLDACQAKTVPVLRRLSGGGTVLQGPGCLNFSLILRIEKSRSLQSISGTNKFIMQQQGAALGTLLPHPPQVQGHTDLTLDGLKFSGNAQRRQRSCLIFHGTLLLNFDISLIGIFLRMPSKQPDYRKHRHHEEFLTNLNLDPEAVKAALRAQWNAKTRLHACPREQIEELTLAKYSTEKWNYRF